MVCDSRGLYSARPRGHGKGHESLITSRRSYCNSIVQALYHSNYFRDNVVNYPPPPPGYQPNGVERKVNVTIRPPPQLPNGTSAPAIKSRGAQMGPSMTPVRPEDKPGTPEYKKKQAMIRGPILELSQESVGPYGMEECTFTGLKDIFTALIESQSRTGVLSPQRFLDIFKRNNEMFRNSMHQDAHEFYGIVLNDVIANVEANAKRMQELAEKAARENGEPPDSVVAKSDAVSQGARAPGTGWVHDIFEGVLTSETRCLTCETTSQRDETFLDLSIDLEEHSSVTSCLQSFSAEEMLCERNKFHCDHCGGLQEAEKRMKVKKLPKILALHLKRFKYTEDYSRLQKLFHRVVYPYHLRLFNTTDDAEDPDRMYELYAVVVHIGGNAYHGHYVAVIKTKDRGWLLFDDEMVEPVDKSFVQNFFGDKPGMACAYVLFYQETTFEKVREELDNEGLDQAHLAAETAELASTKPEPLLNGTTTPLSRLNTQPLPPVDENEALVALDQTKSATSELDAPISSSKPSAPKSAANGHPPSPAPPATPAAVTEAEKATTAAPPKTKAELAREKKEQKAREKAEEKARKAAEKEQAKLAAKERQENLQKVREIARREREELQQAIEESKKTAAEEEKRKKDAAAATTDTATSSEAGGGGDEQQQQTPTRNGFLGLGGRSKTVSRKNMTRKSFAFLHIGSGGKEEDKEKEKDKGAEKTTTAGGGGETDGSTTTTTTTTTRNGVIPSKKEPQPNGTSKHGIHMPWSISRSETAPAGGLQQQQQQASSSSGGKSHAEKEKDGNNKEKDKDKDKPALKERLTFGLGKKKSKFGLLSSSGGSSSNGTATPAATAATATTATTQT
jgi:ubiquitin carboxyl-terminal hydrolase 9/13